MYKVGNYYYHSDGSHNSRKRARPLDDKGPYRKKPKIISFTPKNHNIPLKNQYLKSIKSGEKNIEGRVFSKLCWDIKIKDKIKFFNQQDSVRCEITAIKIYHTFKQMIEDLKDIQKLLPGVRNKEEAIKIYLDIPGYAEKEKIYGVAAFELKKI